MFAEIDATTAYYGKSLAIDEVSAQVPKGAVLADLKLGATVRSDKVGVSESLDYVHTLLPRLKERPKQDAGTLSGGEQQMLAITLGPMVAPKPLCLDEPSVELASIAVEQVGEGIREINKQDISMPLMGQNAHLAPRVASQGYALEVEEMAGWRRDYPEAFARDYDLATGVSLSGWLTT
jgi:branched-chain amino acid transport system ATP-binding protein